MMGRARHSVILPRWRRSCCSSFVVAAVIAAIGTSHAIGQGDAINQNTSAKIAPWVIEHTAAGQQAEFIVVLAEQANLSPAKMLVAKSEKNFYVRDALWAKSQETQGPVRQWLAEQGIEHRSFYIVNAIWLKGTREIAEALAARSDVLRVEGNPHIQNFSPSPVIEPPSQPQAATAVEPGIAYTHAPLVWALGFTGQGIVVAGADTGFRWTHNAIKPHYRGWNGTAANHNYNWHDSIHDSLGNPCGNDSPQPCDDAGHGTHTIGTAIGDDGGTNQIGMAPGAQCIGCRNMDQGDGTPARYIECMEFFLAPYPVGGTPVDGDPSKAPDVTNNSWGCPPSEGCSVATLQAAVEAQRAAGIEMVVAAGNSGPFCSTVVDPPSIYDASYTVGALTTGTDNIANFSSRGPVTADASNRMKPDISAPGTNTRSCLNNSDSAYGALSGTSMATPHVAGAVALLWSARPEFRHNIEATEDALNNSAAHILNGTCDGGIPGTPNNTYGNGRIDVLAAVNQPTPSPTPTVTPIPTATPTPSPTPTPTVTPPPTPTPTATPCSTPTGTQVDGSGTIAVSGGQANFSFHVQPPGRKAPNFFSYSDPAAGVQLSAPKKKINSLNINGNHAQFSGSVKLGSRRGTVSFTVNVDDFGNCPDPDHFSIQLSNGYSASGNLTSGDITIH